MLGAARRLPGLLGDVSTMKENFPESAPHVYATSAPAGGTWRRDADLTLQKNVNCSIFICTDCTIVWTAKKSPSAKLCGSVSLIEQGYYLEPSAHM